MKYKIGDKVTSKEHIGFYVIAATEEDNPEQPSLIDGFDYTIQQIDENGALISREFIPAFEDDLDDLN